MVTWVVLAAAFLAVAAVALYYFKKRRKSLNGLQFDVNIQDEDSFYPEIEKCHEINTKSITCSCEDFREEREQFRHDDPRRLCKHLVRSFVDAGSLPVGLMLFKEGIEQSAEDHRGFPSDKKKFDALVRGKPVSIMIQKETGDEESWIDVYSEAKCYHFSPALETWAKDVIPPHEEQVIKVLYEVIGRPVPETKRKGTSASPHVPTQKGQSRDGSAEEGSREAWSVESILRTVLPQDRDLALKETKSYVAVTFDGSRKWICRLFLNSRKKYIEFPDGRRHELYDVGDIIKYKEELMNTYSEKSPKKGKARMLFPMSENVPSLYTVRPTGTPDNTHHFSRN